MNDIQKGAAMKISGGGTLSLRKQNSHCKVFEVGGFHTQYVQMKKLTNEELNSLLMQASLMVSDDKEKADLLNILLYF